MATLRSAKLEIDLSAVRHNLDLVRGLAGGREVIASIKANAYGFGVVEISRALAAWGVRKLWTGNVDEAVAVREAGIDADILLFGGPEPHQFEQVLRYDLQPTIYDDATAAAASKAASAIGRRAPVWIKVDAGLGRLGVAIEDAYAFASRIAATPDLDLRGVYTHLPFGSIEGRAWALGRYEGFRTLVEALRDDGVGVPVSQVWGSSGLLAGMPDSSEAVCVGHALFGLTPLDRDVGAAFDLKPAIRSLSASILRVQDVRPVEGAESAYGRCSEGRAVTLAIGTGDGMRKAKAGEALIGGRRVPIRAFTLEYLVVDASAVEGIVPGDKAMLIGGSDDARISLEDWADWTGTSPLDVMMALSQRLPVSYVNASGLSSHG